VILKGDQVQPAVFGQASAPKRLLWVGGGRIDIGAQERR
jgi:hypothetical protein